MSQTNFQRCKNRDPRSICNNNVKSGLFIRHGKLTNQGRHSNTGPTYSKIKANNYVNKVTHPDPLRGGGGERRDKFPGPPSRSIK